MCSYLVKKQDADVLIALVRRGPDAAAAAAVAAFCGSIDTICGYDGGQVLTAAVWQGVTRPMTLAALAARGDANPSRMRTRTHCAPLWFACLDAQKLQCLLAAFPAVDLNQPITPSGKRALQCAVENGNAECVRLLLNAGACVEAADLQVALMYGRYSLASALQDRLWISGCRCAWMTACVGLAKGHLTIVD